MNLFLFGIITSFLWSAVSGDPLYPDKKNQDAASPPCFYAPLACRAWAPSARREKMKNWQRKSA
jgi:hypothetical protein